MQTARKGVPSKLKPALASVITTNFSRRLDLWSLKWFDWYVLFSLRYLRGSNRLQGTALAMRENCQKNYPIYSVGPIRWRGQLVTGLKATAAYQIARSWSWSMPGPRAKSHEIFMRGNQWKITNTVLHTKNNRKLRDILAMSHDNEWSIECTFKILQYCWRYSKVIWQVALLLADVETRPIDRRPAIEFPRSAVGTFSLTIVIERTAKRNLGVMVTFSS